jgi:hypothetical protein
MELIINKIIPNWDFLSNNSKLGTLGKIRKAYWELNSLRPSHYEK